MPYYHEYAHGSTIHDDDKDDDDEDVDDNGDDDADNDSVRFELSFLAGIQTIF